MAWPLALAGALFATLLLTVAYRAFFRWLAKLAKLSETDLDDLFLKRMRLPAKGLVVLLSAHVFVVLQQIENATVSKVVAITELLLISYLVIEALETAVLDYWLRERKKVELPAVVRHLVLVIVYSVAVLSVIGAVTGVNLAPVIATSTVITVVLGLALQDTLGNLFSGLALSLEKPFADGDWILVDGIEGLVVHMGWRATHIRTFSWDVVIIPNSVIAKARVQNFSAPDKVTARNLEFPVALHATPREVEEAARAACKGVPEVQTDPPPKIWLVALTPLFARYIVKFWVPDFKIHDDVESDLLKALSEELKRCSISLSPSGVGIDAESRVVARPGGRE
ncbi:MAG: mechanosensitive ion channel family protein [Deltaproteobacteria bacterium]|nr:mechanosensitive ion channel family protein [Deltaproteobacteria bacterium]